MKTKEEILDQVNFFITPEKKQQILVAMEEYATQCQEDMADKKYTEEDIKKAFDSGYDIRSSYGDRDDNMTAEQYINSLNKQD
jgi:hypothetical protein